MITINPELLEKPKKSNPMLKWGKGPEGKRCKECIHFLVKQLSNRYFKCSQRKITNGPGTDHRANWPACAKFQQSYKILEYEK